MISLNHSICKLHVLWHADADTDQASGGMSSLEEDQGQHTTSTADEEHEALPTDAATPEEGIQQAVAASQNWSRILRRPRKRKGHVIVDVCTAAGHITPPASAWKECPVSRLHQEQHL